MKKKRLLKSVLLYGTALAILASPLYADYIGDFLKANIFVTGTSTTFGSSNHNNDITINGDLTVTGSMTGGSSGWVGANGETITNTPDGTVAFTYDDDAALLGTQTLASSNTATSNLDYFNRLYKIKDSGGTLTTFAEEQFVADDVTDTSEAGSYALKVMVGGTLTRVLYANGTAFVVDPGVVVGSATTFDLYTNTNVNFMHASATGGVTLPATSHEYQFVDGKAGTTAGWAVRGGNNIWHSTLPASQTGSTLVVPVQLRIGQTITGFKVVCQVESAGNTVTIDGDLRKTTTAAADLVDASVGTITQVSVTADTAVAQAKTGLSDTVAADEAFYVLITATTAANTDIDFQGVTVTVTEN